VYDRLVAGRDDRASGSHAPPSGAIAALAPPSEPLALASDAVGAPIDALSDVLRGVRLSGALFFRVEARAPWGLELPDGATLAPSVLPRAQHVISYHVVTDGECWGMVQGEAPVRLEAGDVLVLPRGDAYAMSMTPGRPAGPDRQTVLAFMRQMAAGHLPFTVREGGAGADRLHLVCGFLGCDMQPFNPLLATLPRLLHVRRAAAGSDEDPLGHLIQFTIAEARERRAGGECVRLRLSELIFVEVVRRHLATLPAEGTGWLAALRDPTVGLALARLHEQPARAWTLASLARDVGLSRSVLADRFTHLVGHPPIQYLTHWRMQVAARLLAESSTKVSAVSREVGYDSEAAFSRAFKKLAGVAPGAWRSRPADSGSPRPPRRRRRA
jgi:AraC-like DNA-binding protein